MSVTLNCIPILLSCSFAALHCSYDTVPCQHITMKSIHWYALCNCASQVDFRWSQVHLRWTFGGVPCASLWQSLRHTLSPSAVMLSDFWASTAPSSFVTRLCFFFQQQIVMLLLTHLSFHSHLAAPIIQRLYDIQANICSPSKPSHHPPIWPTHLMHPSIHLHPSALIAFHPTIHPSAQLKCNILLIL